MFFFGNELYEKSNYKFLFVFLEVNLDIENKSDLDFFCYLYYLKRSFRIVIRFIKGINSIFIFFFFV